MEWFVKIENFDLTRLLEVDMSTFCYPRYIVLGTVGGIFRSICFVGLIIVWYVS